MPARHRAVGKGEGHDGQAVGEGNRDETRQADTVADHGSGAGADEYIAKVPMNSARSLGAIRLDIVDSRDEIDRSAGLRQGPIRWLRGGRWTRAPPAGEASRPTPRRSSAV